jgi:FMN phosphatase YigB (HAD superfamily)
MIEAVIFDLDDTLLDTRAVAAARTAADRNLETAGRIPGMPAWTQSQPGDTSIQPGALLILAGLVLIGLGIVLSR